MLTHAPQTTQGQAGQPSFFYPGNSTSPGPEWVLNLDPLPPPTCEGGFQNKQAPGFALPGLAEKKKKKNKGRLKQAQELLSGNCWRWGGVTVFMEERVAFCFPL